MDPSNRNRCPPATRWIVRLYCALLSGCSGESALAGEKTVVDLDHPSLVSFHLKDMTGPEAARVLTRESHMRWPIVWDRRVAPGHVTLNAEQEPYLVVLERLCEQMKVTPVVSVRERGLELWPTEVVTSRSLNMPPAENGVSWITGPAVSDGPFLIVPRAVTRQRRMDTERPQDVRRTLTLSMIVMAEPNVTALATGGGFDVQEASDDLGNPLNMPHAIGTPSWSGGGGNGLWTMVVFLQYPAQPGTKITHFKAGFRVRAVSAFENVEISLVEPNVRTLAAGLPCSVRTEKSQTTGELQTALTLSPPEGSTPEAWAYVKQLVKAGSRFRVFDAAGRAVPCEVGAPLDHDDTVQFHLLCRAAPLDPDGKPQAGPPAKLVWEVPLESKDLTLPVEFKDMPLPR